MYILVFFSVCIGCVTSQLDKKPPEPTEAPPSILPCSTPEIEPLPEIKAANIRGIYPRDEISKATNMSADFKANKSFVKRSTCDCYRKNKLTRKADEDADLAEPPAGAAPQKPPPPPPFPKLVDSCPTVYKTIQFPFAQYHNGEICWLLSPFQGMRCPYRDCRYGKCDGVKSTASSPFLSIAVCRPTSYKYRYYYIWCKTQGLVLRYVKLPQCCSCMYLKCN